MILFNNLPEEIESYILWFSVGGKELDIYKKRTLMLKLIYIKRIPRWCLLKTYSRLQNNTRIGVYGICIWKQMVIV